MAEATSNRFEDISSYLSRTPTARAALRLADELNLPESEWQFFIDHIRELNASKE